MDEKYNTKKIRTLLIEGFEAEDLRRLCFDDFRTVHDKLTREMGKADVVDRLIEHTERTGEIEKLLSLAKEHNPAKYAIYHPYHISSSSQTSGEVHQKLQGNRKRLCERITDKNYWPKLHQVAIQAAVAGGMAAMGYYRQEMDRPSDLIEDKAEKNPSTLADLHATSRILQTIDPILSTMHRGKDLNCGLSYLAEETKYFSWFEKNLNHEVYDRIQSPDEFFIEQENVLRVIVDGIDGTGSFTRWLPLFCSAVAILVDNQARVSAIYDPIHHVVYSALLWGSYDEPEARAEASAWQVATGDRINLVMSALKENPKPLQKEAIAIHLTRNKHNLDKLSQFLGVYSSPAKSMLERLAIKSGGIYAINSGVVAMADVARGALGGFVNIVTNLWDVAAGEVLVRACGGKVTGNPIRDFEGRLLGFIDTPITYSSANQISVVAAKAHLHDQILEILAG